ncbi:MAG: Fe-Mn family superoxide dismutase [Candidatus Eisenbacteria bacterium]
MKTHTPIDARNFTNIRNLKGLPSRVLAIHDEHYRASVAKANEIMQALVTADRTTVSPVYSELRSLKTALQPVLASVKSYEIFFTHLGGDARRPQKQVSEMFVRDFGGYEAFVNELTATAIASRGWVALSYDLDMKRLMCVTGDTPEQLTVWNNAPILVLEVSASTAALEFGGDRRRYVSALLDSVDWAVAERNLEDAIGLQPAGKPY